jgi:hypothetical protein
LLLTMFIIAIAITPPEANTQANVGHDRAAGIDGQPFAEEVPVWSGQQQPSAWSVPRGVQVVGSPAWPGLPVRPSTFARESPPGGQGAPAGQSTPAWQRPAAQQNPPAWQSPALRQRTAVQQETAPQQGAAVQPGTAIGPGAFTRQADSARSGIPIRRRGRYTAKHVRGRVPPSRPSSPPWGPAAPPMPPALSGRPSAAGARVQRGRWRRAVQPSE